MSKVAVVLVPVATVTEPDRLAQSPIAFSHTPGWKPPSPVRVDRPPSRRSA